jgi:hypothetical protein
MFGTGPVIGLLADPVAVPDEHAREATSCNVREGSTVKLKDVPLPASSKRIYDGEEGFVHFFTLEMPGKETTFTVPQISVPVLSRVLDKVMDRYTESGQEVSKARTQGPYCFSQSAATIHRTVYSSFVAPGLD